MSWSRRNVVLAGAATLLVATFAARVHANAETSPFEGLEGLEDFWTAIEAYVYGYPLVTMEMTRRVMTNVAKPDGNRAPMGQFIKTRAYPERVLHATSPRRTPTRSTPSRVARSRARSRGC